MSYTFIYNKKDGWWLKISSIRELLLYWETYNTLFETSLAKLPETKEFGRGMQHADEIDTLIGLYAKAHKLLFAEAKTELLTETKKAQFKALNEHGAIYINRKHGWNFIEKEAEQFVHRRNLIFPHFKDGKIKIERYPLGNHYYVFVDDIQIRDRGNLKWNTPEEAQDFVKKLVLEETNG